MLPQRAPILNVHDIVHVEENSCRVPVVSVLPRQQRRSRRAVYRGVGEEVVDACALTSHHVDGERHAEALHQRQVLVVRKKKDEVGLLPCALHGGYKSAHKQQRKSLEGRSLHWITQPSHAYI